jgi:SUMO ligase MMS21 Smc5/6 complex component
LTLKLLDDPLTSKVCKHSYSKTAIYEYLGKNPHEKKGCPASGCAQKISRADLVQEEKLVRRVRDFGRRALRRQQEEADAAKADTLDVDIDDE